MYEVTKTERVQTCLDKTLNNVCKCTRRVRGMQHAETA